MRSDAAGEAFPHAGLAMMAARRFWIEGYDLEDLYQEACYAIIRGLPLYDPSKGRVSTFAARCAFNQMLALTSKRAAGKRWPAGELLSLEGAVRAIDEREAELGETIEAPNADPALIVEQRDEIRRALNLRGFSLEERTRLVSDLLELPSAVPRRFGTSARRKIRAAA